MSVHRIVTGVLSYGMSGRVFHTPFLDTSSLFELRAVVERSSKNAQKIYPDIISYNSVKELLANPEIELVIVNTPNDTHFKFAKKALLAGKHVLIEKPFTPTAEEARELFALGMLVNKNVLPYHNRRFDSDFLSLKDIIEKEEVGRPIELHLRFDRLRPAIGAKIFKETKRAGSGILYDLGSHLVDQAISLFGKPKQVTKVLSKHRKGTKVDDYAFLLLSYEGGLSVHITVSMLVTAPQDSFVLHGTRGTFTKKRVDMQENQLQAGMSPTNGMYGVELSGCEGKLTIASESLELTTVPVPSERGDYMALFDAVYTTIREGKPYFVSQEQLITQLEILQKSNNKK